MYLDIRRISSFSGDMNVLSTGTNKQEPWKTFCETKLRMIEDRKKELFDDIQTDLPDNLENLKVWFNKYKFLAHIIPSTKIFCTWYNSKRSKCTFCRLVCANSRDGECGQDRYTSYSFELVK